MQDIAVDGWALTLLSRRHVGYASTCQTMGMNMGYFTSITVFLALNDASFCNRFLRAAAAAAPVGFVSLTSYMRFWSFAFAIVTLAVWLLKAERPPTYALHAASHDTCTAASHDTCSAASYDTCSAAACALQRPRSTHLQCASMLAYRLWQRLVQLACVQKVAALLVCLWLTSGAAHAGRSRSRRSTWRA